MIDRSIALPWVWLNEKLTKASAAKVSVFDRSFTLGDGVFDTLRILDTCPLQWRAHWQRFSKTARQLGFKMPSKESEFLSAIQELLQKNRCIDAVARMHLSRGVGPRGYSPVHAGSPTLVISLHAPLEITIGQPRQWKLGLASSPFPNCQLSSANKTASRIFNIAMKMEADRAGFDDALLLNSEGQVVEAISSNIFWMKGGMLFTPPLNLGTLPGTTRSQVLKIGRSNKIACAEQAVPLSELTSADAIFLSVSTAGIIEVVKIGKTEIRRHSIVAELHATLEQQHQREAQRFLQRRSVRK